MIHKVFVDGKPYWLDDVDGTMLPPISGGQWGTYRDPGYGAGTAPAVTTGDTGGGDGVKLPLSIQAIGGGVGILVDADGVPVVGDDGMPILRNMETGGGGSAPAFSGTETGIRLQYELDDALRRGDDARARQLQMDVLAEQQKFQAEQNRLTEEAALKRERFGVLQNLVEGFLQSQQRASEFMLQIQPDPFKFAAGAMGMPVLGTTPQEGYAGALQEFTQRPAPTMDPNAPLSAIEGGISSIMGQQFPLQPGMFGGMSGGGTVPMGASGTFLVGEGGPEVMEVTPSGVTVKPLSGGFQYGGGVDFDVSTIMQGLAPLYTSLLGDLLDRVPTVTRKGNQGIYSAAGGATPFSMHGYDVLERMGVRPSLVRFADAPTVYFRDPTTGELRHMGSKDIFEQSNLNWGDVVNFAPETRSRFTFGPTMTSPLDPGTIPSQIGPFGPMSTMAIQPTTGALLPAPYKIAAERRRQSLVNPQLYDIGTYAYNYPNSPIMPGALKTAEDIYTPSGMARGPIGFR